MITARQPTKITRMISSSKRNHSATFLMFGIILGITLSYSIFRGRLKSASLDRANAAADTGIAQRDKTGSAWTLIVTLTFQSNQEKERILQDWTRVARHCQQNEPFLYHYEVGQNDSDPLKVHIVERYESKEKYLSLHKNGEEFIKFRPKLKALQDEGRVTIEGFSFQELGYGFVR